MKKTLLAMLAMAAAITASAATTPNLVTNGEPGNNLNGWTNFGSSNFESWFDWEDYNWFRAGGDDSRLSQTIVLADKGISPESIAYGATVKASIVATGGNTGNATVYQLGADDGVLASNTVFAVKNQVASTSYPEIEFALNPSARKLKYELVAEVTESSYNLKFRNCSLKVTTLPQYQITFISNGATVGTTNCFNLATLTPPAASRDGYRFLGYFTQTSGGEQVFDGSYALVNSSAWTPTDGAMLYAHWVIESVNFSFVSGDATVGSAEYQTTNSAPAAPTVNRNGDYQFLGYFTEDGLQVYDENFHFVQSSLSSLPSDVTLYAHWTIPEGSIAKLVYRGQLNLLTGEAATHSGTYTKKMHFRVYDGAEATTPLWSIDNQDVTVNADGSFVHAFGDEALAALIATGKVTHVGLAIGPTAGLATELKPRRELRPVAAVNRALTAEGAALDIRIGNLVTENALVAADATVSHLEVAGTVNAPGAGRVSVSPLVVGPDERTRLLRGKGVTAFSRENPTNLTVAVSGAVLRGQVLATAPSDGIALISCKATGERALRCPAVIQYCREGDKVRAPTSDAGGLKVTFFPFVGKEGK